MQHAMAEGDWALAPRAGAVGPAVREPSEHAVELGRLPRATVEAPQPGDAAHERASSSGGRGENSGRSAPPTTMRPSLSTQACAASAPPGRRATPSRTLAGWPCRASSARATRARTRHRLAPGTRRVAAVTAHTMRGTGRGGTLCDRSEEHTSELQSHSDLVCRLLLEKK